tara:strand:+ start:10716 stop:11105 length:390 start_codon:yes stop_codon:yes gene_type:complete
VNIENTVKKELGVKNKQLSLLAKKPNCVSSQAEGKAKKVNPINYSLTEAQQMDKVSNVISNMSGADIKQKTDNYLYAVFTTKIMRFKDDVEVYLDDETKLLHFRSASRLGYSDLGVNRKRYEAFAKELG